MTQEGLSEAVRALLRDRMKSFEQLEVLLFMHARATEGWTAGKVSAGVGLSEELVGDALRGLEAGGLLTAGPDGSGHHYQPASPELATAVDELALAYREQRAAVMSQMSTYAIERIRSGTLRAFADSFVLGKGKGDG